MDKWNLKAQLIIEFIILIVALLFMFILFLGVIGFHAKELSKEKVDLLGEDLVFKVQKELELAVNSIDGYHREFYLPTKLYNFNYNISISGNEVILRVKDKDFFLPVISITGDLEKGYNTVNKRGGVVYLNS